VFSKSWKDILRRKIGEKFFCENWKKELFLQKILLIMAQTSTRKKQKAVSKENKLETLSLTYNPNDKATIAIIKIIENCGLFNVVYGLDNEDYADYEGTLEPYTMEEINAMIDEAEKESANGDFVNNEDLFKKLFEMRLHGDENCVA